MPRPATDPQTTNLLFIAGGAVGIVISIDHGLMTGRRLASLIIGTYVASGVPLAIPAALFLIDRNVPIVLAIPLGLALASIALTVVMIPIRIYLALRFGRSDRGPH